MSCFISERCPVKQGHIPYGYSSLPSSVSGAQNYFDEDVVSCLHCPQQFPSVKIYKRHLSEQHPDTLPFSCTICGKGFHTKTGQNTHMLAHDGRTFSCCVCVATFKLKHHLKRHLKIHGLSLCGKCLVTFRDVQELNQHLAQCVSYQ